MNSNIFRYKYARLMAAALAAVICTVLPLVGMPALAGSVPCAAENAAAGDAPEDIFTAVVISDLHYTTDPNANNVLVSGMALVDDITDAIIEEVIDRRPDAFILTGDNTNGGAEADVTALAGKLDRIRQAGIAVVMTTGNHDFNQTDAAFYEEQYFPLLPCVDRDAYSLSYTAVFGEVVLFAMDDNAVDPGGIGQFSEGTMYWLREMLKKYRDRKIVFLSHHTVLTGMYTASSASYRIQNEDLASLLAEYGVGLVLCGHLHSQMLEEKDGLYEVVNSIPFGGAHTLGLLTIRGKQADYHIEPIDFETYGRADLSGRVRELDEQSGARRDELMDAFLAELSLSGEERSGIIDLMNRFLAWYVEGSIADHLDEIREDRYYDLMIETLWEHNYGPWMQAVMDAPPRSAVSLEFTF